MNINIYICVSKFPRISETFILSQIKYILQNNNDVKIIALKPSDDGKVQKEINDLNLINKTIYVGQKRNFRHINLISSIFDWKILFRKGYSFRENIKDILIKNSIDKNLKKEINKIDLLHCHFGPIAKKYISFKKKHKIPLVVSFHGIDVLYELKKNEKIYSDVFFYADIITANSNYTASVLKKYGCPDGKIRILPMGIDSSNFDFKVRKLKDNKINIISIGRLVEKKGHEYGIRAIKEVIKEFPNISYKIIGEGPLKNSLRELINVNNLVEHISIEGSMTHSEVKEVLNSAHIFLFPSVTARNGDEEGQGVVLLEAAASGLPIVSTYHDGIPESVIEGENAFLAPERDEFNLAKQLIKCIDSRNDWEKMGYVGREFVDEKFDINKLGDELLNIYNEAKMISNKTNIK